MDIAANLVTERGRFKYVSDWRARAAVVSCRMRIIVLNSGSNGNAVYVESAASGAAVLLDCGLSRRETERRLKLRARSLDRIRAVFITHEHRDHVAGLAQIGKHQEVRIFAGAGTIPPLRRSAPRLLLRPVHPGEKVAVDDLEVTAYPKSHDAADALFFRIDCRGRSFVYATDLGTHNRELAASLAEADGLLLESNYDEEMLREGRYPPDIKARIRSDAGHLSNAQSMRLLETHCNGNLRLLILGHISENNNTHEIVRRELETLFARRPGFRPAVHLASRHEPSGIITL